MSVVAKELISKGKWITYAGDVGNVAEEQTGVTTEATRLDDDAGSVRSRGTKHLSPV